MGAGFPVRLLRVNVNDDLDIYGVNGSSHEHLRYEINAFQVPALVVRAISPTSGQLALEINSVSCEVVFEVAAVVYDELRTNRGLCQTQRDAGMAIEGRETLTGL